MGRHREHDSAPIKVRSLIVGAIATVALVVGGGVAIAAPDFGPGNSQKGPQDAGALCHPPGQTSDFPACK